MSETTQLYEYRGGVLVPVPSAISECAAQLGDPQSALTQAVKSIVAAAIAEGGGGGSAGADGVGGFYPPIRYGMEWLKETYPNEYDNYTYIALDLPEPIDPVEGQDFRLEIVKVGSSGIQFTPDCCSAVFIDSEGKAVDLAALGFVTATADTDGHYLNMSFKPIIIGKNGYSGPFLNRGDDSRRSYPWGSPIRVEVAGCYQHRMWGEGYVSAQAIVRYATPQPGWLD